MIYEFVDTVVNGPETIDFLIICKFELERLQYRGLHVWESSNKGVYHIQFYKYADPKRLAKPKFWHTIKVVKGLHGLPQNVYSRIFKLVFSMDNYDKFKAVRDKYEITVNQTDQTLYGKEE
jgi:hypothetical protein